MFHFLSSGRNDCKRERDESIEKLCCTRVMKRIAKFMQLESHLRKIKCVRESTKTKKCTRWRSRRECSSWGRHRARVWRRARVWWRWSSCFACVATQKTFVLKKKWQKAKDLKKLWNFLALFLAFLHLHACTHFSFFLDSTPVTSGHTGTAVEWWSTSPVWASSCVQTNLPANKKHQLFSVSSPHFHPPL